MLLKLLRKYDINKYYFIYYKHPTKGHVETLVVEEDPLNYIDIFNKEMVSYSDCKTYRVPLTSFPRPYNKNKITPLQAKKWAKKHFDNYAEYVQEQEEIKHPNPLGLKSKVYDNVKRPPDIYI